MSLKAPPATTDCAANPAVASPVSFTFSSNCVALTNISPENTAAVPRALFISFWQPLSSI